jgi:hypothetical protein
MSLTVVNALAYCTGANPIKTFWSIFTHSFCKLDCANAMGKKFRFMKWSSLQKRLCKFTPKSFIGLALKHERLRKLRQGSLTERDGSVQSTSSLR